MKARFQVALLRLNDAGFSLLSVISVGAIAFAGYGPFVRVQLFPGFAPSAYKIAEWCVAYFLFLRPVFRFRGVFVFFLVFGFNELLQTISYTMRHFEIASDPIFQASFAFFTSIFALGLIFSDVRLRIPSKTGWFVLAASIFFGIVFLLVIGPDIRPTVWISYHDITFNVFEGIGTGFIILQGWALLKPNAQKTAVLGME